ncbi:hypothetical protein SEA_STARPLATINUM_259 [Streptomyces phage StarPlatinum]|uniref:KTSC domain-containing protein n=1 Tax=Streptomyces phage StarPlatinum TaxID=2283265 RepID=A0A345M8Z1_9CAUD|nr:KTSC domain-containing protein [Streptomyces phage StarPlatinum]AXH66962.1 hypothetical protein SEA_STARPLATINUM_259 [Streptomyces phage StarPlatinum]
MNQYEFPYTDHFTANSSVIDGVYFNKDEQKLAVLFNRGDVQVYSGVSEDEFSRLHSALSVGVYYNRYIKGQYSSQGWGDRVKFYKLAEKKPLEMHPEFNTVEEKSGDVNVTVNIYVNGNPEDIAKAVERLAPSFRAMRR